MTAKINVKHVQNLIDNLQEVQTLLNLHSVFTEGKPGKPNRIVNVLNKSGVVLAIACWEKFIEELAEAAFNHLLENASKHSIFPKRVRTIASKELREAKDEGRIWDLAGDGWKRTLRTHQLKIHTEYLGSFNTAKSQQIDDLFKNLIGLSSITKEWHWQRMSVSDARAKLDDLVVLRGDIAHRVSPESAVRKERLEGCVEFIQNLASITSNRVRDYLIEKTGVPPWTDVRYKNRA